MVIAVTGSSGFLGKHLVAKLENIGTQIIKIDFDNDYDLCDWSTLHRIPDFEIIYHLAAKSFVPDSYKDPRTFYSINLLSTLNALELARKRNAKFVYVSSYVYGKPNYLPIDELHSTNPTNPYMNSKLLCESLCYGFYHDFSMKVIIFRPFNIIGHGQSDQFLIPKIITQLKTGNITLNDPRPKRDFIFVGDVVDALVCAVQYNNPGFNILNLGSGKSYSIEEIVNIAIRKINFSVHVQYTMEYRKDEILDTVADISKIKNELGWKPQITFEDGLADLIGSDFQ